VPQHRNFSSSKIEIFYLVNIGIGIGSVLADMKKSISVIHRIGQFKKWLLSVHIDIGRYEKKSPNFIRTKDRHRITYVLAR
jgi:hypothetical protein